MALIGSLATIRAQTKRMEIFTAAFGYLDELFRGDSPAAVRLRSAAAGANSRVELAGGAFALEQVYLAKARTDGLFESHRKYIDVQVVFEGEEVMELAEISRLTVKQSYEVDRDCALYADFAGASVLRLSAGDAAVFFPPDGHMPGIRPGAAANLVRKTVIKVPVPA